MKKIVLFFLIFLFLCSTVFAYDRYWVGGSGNWSDIAHWSATSGGAGGTSVPSGGVDCFFDASSYNAGSYIVTLNIDGRCNNFSGEPGAFGTATISGARTLLVYGDFDITSGFVPSWGQGYFLAYGKANTINSGGVTIPGFSMAGSGGSSTLKSNLTTSGTVYLYTGTLNTADYNIDVGNYIFGANTNNPKTFNLGSSVIDCRTFRVTLNTILDSNTSTINTMFFGGVAGVDLNYYNFNIISGTGTATINGSNTFNAFTISAGRTVKFENASVSTFKKFIALGTSVSRIKLSNVSDTNHAIFSFSGEGVVSGLDYLDINYINVVEENTWYAGSNSESVIGDNFYWIFEDYEADECSPTINENWVLTSVITCEDKSINIGTGNLIINSGGQLILNNADLLVNMLYLNTIGELIKLTASWLKIG